MSTSKMRQEVYYKKWSTALHISTTPYNTHNMYKPPAVDNSKLKCSYKAYNKCTIHSSHYITTYSKRTPVNWRSSKIMQNKYKSLTQTPHYIEIV